MGLYDNCLLACDIDGTLMVNGYINPENVRKIDFFINEGGKFSISTGRSIGAISDVLAQVKHISPSVVANGCMIYDFENKIIIHDKVLPRDDYRIAKIIINSGINVGVEIHSGPEVFTIRRNSATTLHQNYEKFIAPDRTFEEVLKYNWHKAIYIFENAEDREKIKELITDEKTDCAFIETCAVINGELQNYYEQIPKGVSKASALEKLCDIMNIKKGGLFAIGDYYNDVQMLKLADISAVPCDSPEDVKALAKHITCTCYDGAVADFIDYLIKNVGK